jgi:hypothetical protein
VSRNDIPILTEQREVEVCVHTLQASEVVHLDTQMEWVSQKLGDGSGGSTCFSASFLTLLSEG